MKVFLKNGHKYYILKLLKVKNVCGQSLLVHPKLCLIDFFSFLGHIAKHKWIEKT